MYNVIKNNYINKNWFYLIDENSPCTIDILPWVYAIILLVNSQNPYTFNLEENSKLDFYGFFEKSSPSKILFNQIKDNSKLNIKSLFLNKKTDLKSNIKSFIDSNNSNSQVDIISIIQNNHISLQSSIEIEKENKWICAFLKQKNIFINENWSVSWWPILNVKSLDVKASHSCQIEKLSNKDTFYLQSRWISRQKAISMLIESYFTKTFWCISLLDNSLYQNLFQDFLE